MSKIDEALNKMLYKDKYSKNNELYSICPKCKAKEKSSIYWDKNLGQCKKCGYKQ